MPFTKGNRSDSDIDVVIIDRDDISNYDPEQILPEDPETVQKIRTWLQPTSYDIGGGEYRKHLASHVAGTGAWLTSSATYQQWLQSDQHGLLWIKGIPGSGKSVMAANLIHEIAQANPGCPVLYFFFRQIIDANHEPEALLRDWMDQVLEYSPPLQKQLKDYVEDDRSLDSISMEDMWKDVKMAFASLPGKVFCVADALDEMDRGHDAFLQALGELGQWRPGRVKVLMTSRPVVSVEAPLRKTPCLHLRLQENLVDLDISTYVRFALSRSTIPESEWQIITDAVPGRANGLFLYAKLAMDAFLEPGVDVRQVLSHLPADLNVLYTDLLREHAHRSGVATDIQHLILQSVTHATRPLRLLELAEMIRVSNPDGSERDLKATKELIRAACGPLLEILADETVSVIHHSFTEYLKGITRSEDAPGCPILQMGPTHAQLAVACLRYLQAGCLDAAEVKEEEEEDEEDDEDGSDNVSFYSMSDFGDCRVPNAEVRMRLQYPFFEYAASNWHRHVNRSDAAGYDQTEMNMEIRRFLDNNRSMTALLRGKKGRKMVAGPAAHIEVAAKTGLTSYVKELLKDMMDAGDLLSEAPMWAAAREGHAAVIRELIAAGADPDGADTADGLHALHLAAMANRHEAVRVLLEAGVDPLTPKTRENPGRKCGNAPSTRGHSPLMYACRNGHLEAVEAFLPFLKVEDVHQALSWAAEHGRCKVVARILQHPGVDVNAKVRGDTALFRACGDDPNVGTVKALVEAGADPNLACKDAGDEFGRIWNMTAMHRGGSKPVDWMNCMHQLCGLGSSARNRDELDDEAAQAIFQLLVEAGADIHKPSPTGLTALHGAVGSPVLTRLLLDAGADANATTSSGTTPLHRVRTVEPMVLLVEQGHAKLDPVQDDGSTPLLCMLDTFYKEVVLKFLDYGPNCNMLDKDGNGPLHIALKQSSFHLETSKGLLKGGADPNLRNRKGLTPLHCLRVGERDAMKMADVLLEAGADIDAVDREGKTLLFRQIGGPRRGSNRDKQQEIRDLMDRGASMYARDFKGRTCFHEAVRVHETERRFGQDPNKTKFHFLLGQGLDLKAVDYSGNGLVHEIMRRKDLFYNSGPELFSFVEELASLGLDLEQTNHVGQTPLHLLCAAGSQSLGFLKGDRAPIDRLIGHTKNLNAADHNGVTPLHIAAACGEAFTKKLLDAGADAAVCTHEGLTPLHFAARCRESNVVGLLLDALRRKQGAANTSAAVEGVNASAFPPTGKQPNPITPLYYACRSGRPETVALLLEAGADVKLGNVLQAVFEFEEEDALWRPWEPDTREDLCKPASRIPYTLQDSRRPRKEKGVRSFNQLGEDDTTRLEEILQMLVQHGLDLGGELWGNGPNSAVIHRAERRRRDYTASCLRVELDKMGYSSAKKSRAAAMDDCLHQSLRAASEQTLRDYGKASQSDFIQLLLRKEYHLVEELPRLQVEFLPVATINAPSMLGILVQLGFASLVDKIGAFAAESKLQEGLWHAFGDKTQPGLWLAGREVVDRPSKKQGFNPVPFLLEAVRRELPNMDVVRLLVEKFGVDVNEMFYVSERGKMVVSDSALFTVVRGKAWWHVRQALPYLLEHGADVHARNGSGQTPLHAALWAFGANLGLGANLGSFYREAARLLVEAGADVNARDDKMESCLAYAQHDVGVIRLLKAHGATVTAEAILGAIEAKSVKVLRELLAGGIDPNMRPDKPAEDKGDASKKRKRSHGFTGGIRANLDRHEEYPLYRAARAISRPTEATPAEIKQLERQTELVRVLLDHGADPFAKFLREEDQERGHMEWNGTSVADTPSIEVPEGYQECTIMHELLLQGKLVDEFLRLPGLDVNHGDAKGRSLLHAACGCLYGPDHVLDIEGAHGEGTGRDRSIFQRLLDMGADMEARDNLGRNVLHWMVGSGHGKDLEAFAKSLTTVLKKAPHLVNQANAKGETPLHCAVIRATTRRADVARKLLEAGADPLAVDHQGNGMLHLLAKDLKTENRRDFFRDLAARGVDVNGRNARGETPLFAFCVRARRSARDRDFESHFANSGKEKLTEEPAVPMLKQLGAEFGVRDPKGRGLLHVAAAGDVDVFTRLMGLGLDAMMEDNAHQTPIDVAAACANQQVLALFEKKMGE